MRILQSILLVLVLSAPLFAQPSFPPALVQDHDVSRWSTVYMGYYNTTEHRTIVRQEGLDYTIYSFPEFEVLGSITLGENDEILGITDHDFDTDDEIEIVLEYQDEVSSYYILNLDSGNLLYAIEGDGDDVEFYSVFSNWDSGALNTRTSCWSFIRTSPGTNQTLQLYSIDETTGDWGVFAESEIPSEFEIYRINQFYIDHDTNFEMICVLPDSATTSPIALQAIDVSTGNLDWEIEERDLPFHLSFLSDFNLQHDALYTRIQLTTYDALGRLQLYEVYGDPDFEGTLSSSAPHHTGQQLLDTDSYETPVSNHIPLSSVTNLRDLAVAPIGSSVIRQGRSK